MADVRKWAELQQRFVPPPALSQSRPRAVGLTVAGRALVTFAVLLFAAAIAAGIGMSRSIAQTSNAARMLVTHGVMTDGSVARLWDRGGNRTRVIYRFVVDGRSYEGDTRVSSERRRTLAVGSRIAVRYVPDDPRLHDLGGTPQGGKPMSLTFVVAVPLTAAGLTCLLILNRQRQLLAEGRAVPAIVTGVHIHQSGDGSHASHRSMTYEFRLMSGATASGKADTSRKPPAVGSILCVLYDPDQPRRSMVYPLSLVRPLGSS